MELKRIRINNFRSIKDVTIEIDEINNSKCLILLGKNEAGKSNILKAISAVFGNYKVSSKDQRKEQSGENIKSDDYYIHAIFTLNDDDFIKIEENFKNTYQNTDLINFTDNQTILDLIKDCFKEILLHIDIDNNKEAEMHFWTYENEKINFNQSISLKEKIFQICENGEKSLIIKDLVSKIFGCICEIWNLKEMYICHNWQYKEEYILPSYVNIENFKNDPDICIPLKNVFILGGKTDIKSSFEKVLKQDNNIYNLLDNVSKEATKKIKHMWSDLDEIKISLLPNGDNIQIFIEDHIKFHMEDRSDGFKRFISMLLTLSCEKDKNKIFIIDEPDAFLYPTSAKNLRKELINLGKDSLIIYSTHSPFMIDNNALEHNNRHLIVEKKNGITSIVRENLTKANYLKDELILKAIGTTIFDKI
ncbi:AAA family ATPase, partial [Campylobacter coli]|nr:AAA family ATPase [Campylobacter coli]